THDEVATIIENPQRPILVAVENNHVLGYMFGVLKETEEDNILVAEKSLYIDDICVDQNACGKHVAQKLYQATKELAAATGCPCTTLHSCALKQCIKFFNYKMNKRTYNSSRKYIRYI